jgi:HD-GYP domain-containing protein (c-di-GMP phosphodiesterase class II)
MAGFLHDAGKLQIPLEILNKNGPLTTAERAVMNLHVNYGQNMIKQLSDCKPEYLQAAGEHHAYYDNPDKGYSASAGKRPSLVAQIMALADVYDALANKRAYKDEMPREKIEQIMEQCLSDHQFNPRFYAVFTKEIIPVLEAEKQEKHKVVLKDTSFRPLTERFQTAARESEKSKGSSRQTKKHSEHTL